MDWQYNYALAGLRRDLTQDTVILVLWFYSDLHPPDLTINTASLLVQ